MITRPDKYVGVSFYVGNGYTQSINSLMDPDFVWIKNRDETISHFLLILFVVANKYLRTDTLNMEDTEVLINFHLFIKDLLLMAELVEV